MRRSPNIVETFLISEPFKGAEATPARVLLSRAQLGTMQNLRTPRVFTGRYLPQRHEQFNIYPHRIRVSPQHIRHAGFDANAVIVDAIVSSREALLWSKIHWARLNRALRRHIFGLFVISFSAIQFIPIGNATADNISVAPVTNESAEVTFSASIKASSTPIFQRPVKGSLSQNYWYVHPAIDIPNPYGASIKPIADGKIISAGWDGGFGYLVIIQHKAGFSSRYAHLSSVNVSAGQTVSKKTTIGWVGATGVATGSHLHLELYNDGWSVDPQKYLPSV